MYLLYEDTESVRDTVRHLPLMQARVWLNRSADDCVRCAEGNWMNLDTCSALIDNIIADRISEDTARFIEGFKYRPRELPALEKFYLLLEHCRKMEAEEIAELLKSKTA